MRIACSCYDVRVICVFCARHSGNDSRIGMMRPSTHPQEIHSQQYALMNWLSITVTSQWASRRLKPPASPLLTQPFIQAKIKGYIKAPRHWPLCRESPVTGEFPTQKASNAENVSI